jgi:preprotein translocase subunit YajC
VADKETGNILPAVLLFLIFAMLIFGMLQEQRGRQAACAEAIKSNNTAAIEKVCR